MTIILELNNGIIEEYNNITENDYEEVIEFLTANNQIKVLTLRK